MSRKGFIPVILIAVLALVIAVGGVGIGLAWKTEHLDKWLPPNIKERFGRGEKPEEEPGEEPSEPTKTSELKSLDKTWNLYTSYQLGFSMKVPKKMLHGSGAFCRWDGSSFRPKEGLIPVKIFEDKDNGTVYITGEHYYELAGETVTGEVHYYSKCNKVSNSLERVKEEYHQQAWKIIVKNVSNDAELEGFIKERYGSGCGLGKKTATEQEGVSAPEIKGDGLPLDETKCPINYMTVLKYYSDKNKAISWDMGQAYTFYKSLTGIESDIYDNAMVESFKFLK